MADNLQRLFDNTLKALRLRLVTSATGAPPAGDTLASAVDGDNCLRVSDPFGTFGGGGSTPVATTTTQGKVKVDHNSGGDPVALTSAGHGSAADPHTQYELEAQKNQPGGYAGLDGSTKLSGAQQSYGAIANTACEGNDARLSDARPPTGAAGGHLGGTYPNPDVRGLREAGGPTSLTLGAVADGEFLRRVGTAVVGASPGAGSVNIKEVELDFGATPLNEAEFTIVDAEVTAGSQLLMYAARVAPTGRDLDEVEMEPFSCICGPGAGQLTAFIQALEGPVEGKYKFNYLIG